MAQRLVEWLGHGACWARSVGLGQALTKVRDKLDHALMGLAMPPLRVACCGNVLRGYLRHRSFLASLQGEQYEHFMRELLLNCIKPGMVVVDGGAHIGLYSILLDRALGGSGVVLAFEPDPHNFRALRANVEANRCRSVVLNNLALSNKTGAETFYQSSGTIGSSLTPRHGIGPTMRTMVNTTTLDDALAHIPISDLLIKLDLEGAEPLALKGMGQTFDRSRSIVLFCELNPGALADGGFRPDDLIDTLRHHRFDVRFIEEAARELRPITEVSPNSKGNLFCLRRV